MKEKLKQTKGITLIALVITIIILLILAGVTLGSITSNNGIIKQANSAKAETEKANWEERIDQAIIKAEGSHRTTSMNDVIDELIKDKIINSESDVDKEMGAIKTNEPSYVIEGKLDKYIGKVEEDDDIPTYQGTLGTVTGNEKNNTVVEDKLGNQVKVPSGFKVVNPTDTVPDGIVIKDVSHTATAGSQFVWIPVGEVKKEDGTIETITLGRYSFDSSGNASVYSGDYKEEDSKDTASLLNYGNIIAKDITDFTTKANASGGYYIGRYEARTATQRTAETEDSGLTQITCKPDNYVYNYVTQPQSATLSKNMYNDSNFESDLVNSYAWDTTIVYLQLFGNNNNYANQTSINSNLSEKGTNADVICNIYDMASNCYEWTTETASSSNFPYVHRGGCYLGNYYSTSGRSYLASNVADFITFRPILYL